MEQPTPEQIAKRQHETRAANATNALIGAGYVLTSATSAAGAIIVHLHDSDAAPLALYVY